MNRFRMPNCEFRNYIREKSKKKRFRKKFFYITDMEKLFVVGILEVFGCKPEHSEYRIEPKVRIRSCEGEESAGFEHAFDFRYRALRRMEMLEDVS